MEAGHGGRGDDGGLVRGCVGCSRDNAGAAVESSDAQGSLAAVNPQSLGRSARSALLRDHITQALSGQNRCAYIEDSKVVECCAVGVALVRPLSAPRHARAAQRVVSGSNATMGRAWDRRRCRHVQMKAYAGQWGHCRGHMHRVSHCHAATAEGVCHGDGNWCARNIIRGQSLVHKLNCC